MKKRISILLVEDNPDHALLESKAMVELCKDLELNIMMLDNGRDAISYVKGEGRFESRELPDMILLDLKMPGTNGFDVIQAIKNDARYKHIPIVALSSSDLEDDVKKVYFNGGNSYVIKPLEADAFQEKVSRIPPYWGDVSELPPKKKRGSVKS